jgi:hypothetical protein
MAAAIAQADFFYASRLPDLAGQSPTGFVDRRTTHGWCVRGVCGIRLPSVMLGGRRAILVADYARWIEQITQARESMRGQQTKVN